MLEKVSYCKQLLYSKIPSFFFQMHFEANLIRTKIDCTLVNLQYTFRHINVDTHAHTYTCSVKLKFLHFHCKNFISIIETKSQEHFVINKRVNDSELLYHITYSQKKIKRKQINSTTKYTEKKFQSILVIRMLLIAFVA